jgi:hypothetical protein
MQPYLKVNRFNDTLWFNKEAFEEFLRWIFRAAVVRLTADPLATADQVASQILAVYDLLVKVQDLGEQSEYRLESLVAAARQSDAPAFRPRGSRTTRKSA